MPDRKAKAGRDSREMLHGVAGGVLDRKGTGRQGQKGSAGAAGGLPDRKAKAGRDSREMQEQQVTC